MADNWKSRHPFRSGQIVVANLDIALSPQSGRGRVLACGSAVVVHGIGCDTYGNWISVHKYPGHYFQASDFSAGGEPAPALPVVGPVGGPRLPLPHAAPAGAGGDGRGGGGGMMIALLCSLVLVSVLAVSRGPP